jgi:hypothetical protein
MDPDLNNSPQNSGSISTAEALADLNKEIADSGQPQNTQETPALDPGFESLSFDQKLDKLNQANKPGNTGMDRTHISTATKFIREAASFIAGRENDFRIESFSNLDTSKKTEVYKNVNDAINSISVGYKKEDRKYQEWMKGKIELVGEPGISYENGQLKIGPEVSKEEIINFVKQKSTEEEEQNGGAQPNPDIEPDLPSQEEITEPEDQEDFDLTSIDGELLEKLSILGVGVEKVEALPSLAIYDEGEKILKVRRDANVEFVNEYIKNAVFPEQDGVDQLGPSEEVKPEPEIANEQPVETIRTEEEVNEAPTNPPNQTQETEVSEPKSETEEGKDLRDSEPEWLKGTERAELERLRNNASFFAASNKDVVKKVYEENKIGEETEEEFIGRHQQEYREIKGHIAYKIKESLTREALAGSDSLSEEEQERLNKKINDTIFEELVIKENEAYLNYVRANRRETVLDKTKEILKTAVGLKAVKWYLGLSRKQRFALNFGVGTVAGLTFGAGAGAFGALGYVGKRVASGAAGVAAGEWASKRWSVEELNEKERKEIEDLKNSSRPLEEKSEEILKIQQKYKKEKIKMVAKRVGVTALAGAGTGLLANFAENFAANAIGGTGGSGSVLENRGGTGLDQNRLYRNAPKFSQEPVSPKSDATLSSDQSVKSPASQDLAAVKPEVKAQVQELDKSQVDSAQPEAAAAPAADEPAPAPSEAEATVPAPKTPAPEAVATSLKPETLVHEVKAGDSVWKMLKETLENNDKFKNLGGVGSPQEIADQIEAKQTRVLQSLVDEVLKNNEKYGIGSNGEISIGQKVDFSNLFADSKKLETLLNEAENLKPAQITSIIDSNHKIETWLSANPGKQLDLDEIVNQKPKVFEMPAKISTTPELPDGAPEVKLPISITEEIEKIKTVSSDVATKEVAALDQSLGIPENGQGGLRTMSSDTSAVARAAEINGAVNQVFNNEINNIYGESHLLGLQKIAGVATKEWKTISGLPARRVLEYFKSPETSDLPQTILQELQTSEKHRKLVEWVADLVEEAHKHSNADFKPYDNGENMESYIKRIGGFLMRQQSQPPVLDKS